MDRDGTVVSDDICSTRVAHFSFEKELLRFKTMAGVDIMKTYVITPYSDIARGVAKERYDAIIKNGLWGKSLSEIREALGDIYPALFESTY